MSTAIAQKSATYMKERPEIRPGFTVRVYERIQEGGKERLQAFEGLVISVHKGQFPTDTTITVRKVASGVGVEKIYTVHSPNIDRIEVKKVAKIRRAKLFFLRGRSGKAARLSERFTTADEFASVAPPVAAQEEVETMEVPEENEAPAETSNEEAPVEEKKEEATEEKPKEEEKKEEAPAEKPVGEKKEAEEPKKDEAPAEEEKKAD